MKIAGRASGRSVYAAGAEDRLDLTEWEDGFISSIAIRVEEGRDLTDRQDDVLEKIWRRAL